jgi:hypothetical protein
MYVCVLSPGGERLLHRDMQTSPATLLRHIAPCRADVVVAVERLVTGYWLAGLCAQEGIPCALGHALSMQAVHGGKAGHDELAVHKIAALPRGGILPQAYVCPAAMRATRDLLRRRTPLRRKRAELPTHIPHPTSQDNLPEIGKQLASKANRAGVAERFAEPAVPKRIAVDLELVRHDHALRRAMAWSVLTAAQAPHPHTLDWLRTAPGIGEILSLGLRYAIQGIYRFPRGRSLSRTVAWCSVPRTPLGRATAQAAPGSAMPPSGGPSPKRPCCFCATSHRGRKTSPVWRKHTARARPWPPRPVAGPGPSVTGSHAQRPLIWARASTDEGGEWVRPTPHWTALG